MKHITRILSMALLAFGIMGCEKEESNNGSGSDTATGTTVDALVLNEGNWGGNNASITAINTTEGEVVQADWFASSNGRGLGDVAQDMIVYGSKLYATVTFSNSLEVIDTQTGASRRMDMGNRNPRNIAAHGGKLYVSCYNPRSVVRIDTATLTIEASCPLGDFQPEGIAVEGGKLFVASSFVQDGQNYTYDDKVYVIDLSSFANPQTITVGSNPQDVQVIADGKVIVNYWGDYATNPAGSAIIDAATLNVTQTNQALTKMSVYNGKAYGYVSEYDASWNQTISYKTVSVDGTVADFPFSFSISGNPYGISINPQNGDIYLMSDGNYSMNGTLFCYSAAGDLRFMLEAGMLPKKVVFF